MLAGFGGSGKRCCGRAYGRAVSSGSNARTVRVWDLDQGVELTSFTSDSEISALAVTPSFARKIFGGSAGLVHLLGLCRHE